MSRLSVACRGGADVERHGWAGHGATWLGMALRGKAWRSEGEGQC